MDRKLNRRTLLRGLGLGVTGIALGAVGATEIPHWCGWDQPPLGGGYASAADNEAAVSSPSVTVRYYVPTARQEVALTFDDGPAPHWTPDFLEVLADTGTPATFFLVGRNVRDHADLIRDRLTGHEVGNHSWAHRDLATMDLGAVRDDLTRTHETIRTELGRTPTLLRPPYGHLGGSTILAADTMGYDLVLWNTQMHERRYLTDQAAQARDIIDTTRPGGIILAHDAGDDRRLVAQKALHTII